MYNSGAHAGGLLPRLNATGSREYLCSNIKETKYVKN